MNNDYFKMDRNLTILFIQTNVFRPDGVIPAVFHIVPGCCHHSAFADCGNYTMKWSRNAMKVH